MDEKQVMEAMLELLETGHIQIRRAELGGEGGGLCAIGQRQVLLLDSEASVTEQCSVCAAAVIEVADIENIYMKPQVREFIQAHSATFGPCGYDKQRCF